MDTGLRIDGFRPEEWMKWSPGVPKWNTGSFTCAAGVCDLFCSVKKTKKKWRLRSEVQATWAVFERFSTQAMSIKDVLAKIFRVFEMQTEWIWSSHFYRYLSSSERGLKISGLNADSKPNLYDAGAVLHQLSYETNWDGRRLLFGLRSRHDCGNTIISFVVLSVRTI